MRSRRMERITISIVCALLVILAPARLLAGEGVNVSFSVQSQQLRDTVEIQLPATLKWQLAASDLVTGKSLIDAGVKGKKGFLPGSLAKLFITAALADRDSRSPVDLASVVSIVGNISAGILRGDVILKGSGNPLLSTVDLLAAVEKLKSSGVREISGDVIVDDSLFEVKDWNNRYAGPAYGMPSALGLDLHTLSIAVRGDSIHVDPPNDAVKVSLNPSGEPGIRRIDDLTYEITGAGKRSDFRNRFSVADPTLYAGGVFLTLLKKAGIAVSGTAKRGLTPSRASVVARVGLSDLNALIADTNKQSLNVAADNMLLLLGALIYGAPGTREKGVQAINNFLGGMGVPLSGLVIHDGSGISDRNRVSAEQMVDFLTAASGKPWFNSFYESLSRPGMDGRLRDFGYRSEHIRMKSAQLTDAYGLAGYIDRRDGKKIAFAYLVNGTGPDVPAAASAGIEVLRQLSAGFQMDTSGKKDAAGREYEL